MLFLLLAACGYPSYYPQTALVADTSGADGMPCGATWSFDAVELRAVSTASVPMNLYAVGGDCSEALVGPLRRDVVTTLTTNPGAVFAARDDAGALFAWAQIPYGEPTFAWEVR